MTREIPMSKAATGRRSKTICFQILSFPRVHRGMFCSSITTAIDLEILKILLCRRCCGLHDFLVSCSYYFFGNQRNTSNLALVACPNGYIP